MKSHRSLVAFAIHRRDLVAAGGVRTISSARCCSRLRMGATALAVFQAVLRTWLFARLSALGWVLAAVFVPAPCPAAGAPKPPPPLALTTEWKPLFDGKSMAGWKTTDFGGHGEVRVEDGKMIVEAGVALNGIDWTNGYPRTDYELALEAMKVEGGDFFCGLTVPANDAYCTLVVGGWAGAVVGISSVDGEDASMNETTKLMNFVKDRWYRIRLRVTPAKIEAWIDDDQVVDLSLAGKKISMRPGEIEMSVPLGISSYQTTAALRNIRIRAVEKKPSSSGAAAAFTVLEDDQRIAVSSSALEAVVRKKGYVTGVAGGSFVDKKSGFRDAGFGLDIVDWIMEPGSDAAYRSQLPGDLAYEFNNGYHGKTPKRSIEGPQICTQAKELSPRVIRGKDFVAITTSYNYRLAAPGKKTGSEWRQTIVFPEGKRYFISSDRITSVNASEAAFLRLDMPGHIKHQNGDTFSEVYLSYAGRIPAGEFLKNFAPDERFNYRRDRDAAPKRFIRAYHLRDPKTGALGPWLAGMTLDPSVVSEAWCHQRDYVCLIEEFGGRPVKAGESFSAAFIVGYFDSIEEMEKVCDEFARHTGLEANEAGWKLTKAP